eukprot:c14613_g1_i1 orf=303-1472(-)
MNGTAPNVGAVSGLRSPGAPGSIVVPGKGGVMDKGADYANYFCTYAFLYHQKEMLSDRVRMNAYFSAIFKNKDHFKGKIVLDVGTGSGILAIWAAQAGARKVYAVEATKMAEHARQLVVGNGLAGVVEVIEGSIEDVELPEKVDVIISEWMGYFLVRESMFDSVMHARDCWLKPTGIMYPSQACMWLAPVRSGLVDIKMKDYQNAMADWDGFAEDALEFYGVDMSILTKSYLDEQRRYYLQTSLWNNLYPNQIIGTPVAIKEFDCHTAILEDVASVHSAFRIPFTAGPTKFCGFAGWFDVHFRGSQNNPAINEVHLTTAPSVHNTTHWGQQVFLLHPPLDVNLGDVLEGTLDITRSKDNHRLMDVKFTHNLKKAGGEVTPTMISRFYIE